MGGIASSKGYGIGIPPKAKVITPFSATILDENGLEIGYVISLNYDTSRTVERIRHLNAYDAGRIIEQVPTPENYSLSAEGYSLYTKELADPKSLIGRLTQSLDIAVFETLNAQHLPFTLVKEVTHLANGLGVKTFFYDCWLARYTETYATRNAVVTGSATIQPSYIETKIVKLDVGGSDGIGGKLPPDRGAIKND